MASDRLQDTTIGKAEGIARLVVVGTVLVNLFALALVVFLVAQDRERAVAEASFQTQNYAKVLEESLVGFIGKIDITLVTVVDEMERRKVRGDTDESDIEFFLARQDRHLPDALGLRLLDAKGITRHAVGDVKARNADLSDRPYFIRTRDDPNAGLVISQPVLSRISSQWVVTMGRRINNPDGSFGGETHVAVTVDRLIGVLSRLDLGPKGNSGLWDGTTLLARYSRDDKGGAKTGATTPSPTLRALLDSGQREASYRTASGIDGIERLYAFRQVGDYPLYLVVGLADEDYLAEWRGNTARLVVFMLLFLVGTVVFAWLVRSNWEHREQARLQLIAANVELEVRTREAESASVAKSRFLATMSHEIRTPLNGILGMAQIQLMPGIHEEERQESARTILNSGRALLGLLNDILDLSKVEAGRIEVESLVFDPRQLIQEVLAVFAQSARAKGLRLEGCWQGPEDVSYRSDPLRLRQMLTNLIGNAIKFTSAGFVRVEARETDLPAGGCGLEFRVADSGIGIPAEKQDLLFQPFSQVDASITRKYGGTGLGLSIVSNLARRMGGDVWCDSREGEGTVMGFRVQASRVNAEEEKRQVPREPPAMFGAPAVPRGSAGHILIVEDNPINRAVTEALLKRHALRFESVEDGQQAVERVVAGTRPALILMDCQMPVMDGFEATRRIREWETGQGGSTAVPIVAMTASAYAEDRERCKAAGMDDFLAKPIDFDAMAAVLSRWLDQEPDHPAAAVARDGNGSRAPETAATFDEALLVRQLGGDRALAVEIARASLGEIADSLDRLDTALDAGDRSQVARELHTMKGLAAQAGGTRLSACMMDAYDRLQAGSGIDPAKIAMLRADFEALRRAAASCLN